MSKHISAGWKAAPNLNYVVLVDQGVLRLPDNTTIACGDAVEALKPFGQSDLVEDDPTFFYYPKRGLMFTTINNVITAITLDLTGASFQFERMNGHPIELDVNTRCEAVLQTYPNPETEDIQEYEDVIETTFHYVRGGLVTDWVFDNGKLADITFEQA